LSCACSRGGKATTPAAISADTMRVGFIGLVSRVIGGVL
jgi:hypothetical protein